MIVGIGIDSVEIERFSAWHLHPQEQLKKLFSEQELSYCFSSPLKTAERLAARFAVKEAFFKAFSAMTPSHEIPFFTVCKMVSVQDAPHAAPTLAIDWKTLHATSHKPLRIEPRCHVSITHTDSVATAMVLLETDK